MRGHGLCVFERATVAKIGRDPRRPKRVAPHAPGQPCVGCAPLDHAVGVDPVHRFLGQRIRFPVRAAEEGRPDIAADAGGSNVFIQKLFQLVVRRHFVALAAFFVKAQPPAFTFRIVVLDPHGDDGADAREGIGHDADQCPVPQAHERRGIDAVEKRPRILYRKHRGLATVDDVFGPANGVGRVDGEDLTGHQPIEAHANGGEVLLHRRLAVGLVGVLMGLQEHLLDISGHMERLDVGQLMQPVLLAPSEKPADGPKICLPGVFVADGGGEELQKPPRGVLAGAGNEAWDRAEPGSGPVGDNERACRGLFHHGDSVT